MSTNYPEFKESGRSTTLRKIGDAFEDIHKRIGKLEAGGASEEYVLPKATESTLGG